jgi:hypothetical protein
VAWFRDEYADAVRDAGYALRPNEKLVALVFADHAGDPKNPRNDIAWVTWPRLSEQTGIRSKDALNRAIRHLEKRGWLVLVEPRRQHRAPRYRLVIPTDPEVRATYVYDGSEVRETDLSALVDNGSRGTDGVPLNDPEVRETTPEVRETTLRGTRNVPDPSTYPSTKDNSVRFEGNHSRDAVVRCLHRWTADGDCIRCPEHREVS